MTNATDTATIIINLPELGMVSADKEAGTLRPCNSRAANELGLDRPSKQGDSRFKQLLGRRQFEAYATSRIGRPEDGWAWSYENE